MNYQVVFKLLSMILWVMAGAFFICMLVSLHYGDRFEEAAALPSWIACIAVAVFFALSLYFPSRDVSAKLYKKEVLCVIGAGWLLSTLVGAFPYALILDCSAADAVFESASGLTTTGATLFSGIENFPRSVLFWRAFSQWMGGLGVVVFFVAVLSFFGAGGRMLYSGEGGVGSSEVESGRVQVAVKRIFFLYFGISACCFALYRLFGMGWFDGLCHMMTTVSTGGFSVYESSFGHYKSAALEWTAVLFMFLGGMNFALIFALFKGRFARAFRNTELRWYVGILFLSSAAVAAVLVGAGGMGFSGLHDAVRMAVFHVVSLMTTTGFSTADYNAWIPLAHVFFFLLMIVGGCTGSTSGGLKVGRLVIAFKTLLLNVEKSFRPHVVRTMRINSHSVEEPIVDATQGFIVLYVAVFVCGLLTLSVMEPDMSFAGCLGTMAACVSNIGPGLAETGPAASFGSLAEASKLLLSLLMIMGRLEFYPILVLFMPSLWKNFQ